MTPRRMAAVGIVLLALGSSMPAVAQPPEPQPPETPPTLPAPEPERPPAPEDPIQEPQEPEDTVPVPRAPAVRVRVFGMFGLQSFTASESFEAVLDSSSGMVFGAGGSVLLGRNLFVDVTVSRFSADGSRVFVTEGGDVIDLGIPAEVTVAPIDVSLGWRFAGRPRLGPTGKPRFMPVPYAGGGFGFQRYQETSECAEGDEDVDETNGSYHLLGGIELPFTPQLGASVDVLYRWVPDAIGAGGVSAFYDEQDLGGAQIRFRVSYTF